MSIIITFHLIFSNYCYYYNFYYYDYFIIPSSPGVSYSLYLNYYLNPNFIRRSSFSIVYYRKWSTFSHSVLCSLAINRISINGADDTYWWAMRDLASLASSC